MDESEGTTPILDLSNSLLMGLDFVGTSIERRRERPVTIGGCAQRRYLDYVEGLVPSDYRPDLHPDLRVKRYFKQEGIQTAPTNVYVMALATFLAWPLLPITQTINLIRWARDRSGRKSEDRGQRPSDDASEDS